MRLRIAGKQPSLLASEQDNLCGTTHVPESVGSSGGLTSEGFPVVIVVKNMAANAGDARDVGLIPGPGRSPGRGGGNSLQYSCLGNPMDRGTWRAAVHRVARSQIRQKRLSTHARTQTSPEATLLPSSSVLFYVPVYLFLPQSHS